MPPLRLRPYRVLLEKFGVNFRLNAQKINNLEPFAQSAESWKIANRSTSRTALAAVLASTCALTILAKCPAPAGAQEWDPFSQLESNKAERRSKARERKPQAPREGTQAHDAYDGPQDTYSPSAGRTSSPYADPRAPSPPAVPASVSVETLAPLPSAPSSAEPLPAEQTGQATTPFTGPPNNRSQWPGSELAIRQPEASSPRPHASGAAVPNEIWRGLDAAGLERIIASLDLPPRSPALQQLWRRLLVSDTSTPAGGDTNDQIDALRLEAIYRSGLLKEIRTELDSRRSGRTESLAALLEARGEIGSGRREAGCEAIKRVGDIRGNIPKPLRGEAILASGYCAAATGNKAAAGLLAELAREEGVRSSPGLAALDAVAMGVKTDISLAKGQKLGLIDYRILELAGATPPREELVKTATPALLVALASDTAIDADLRVEAGEAAARINAYDAESLASLYRSIAGHGASSGAAPIDGATGIADTSRRRAQIYISATAERTPFKKVRLIRTFIDSARRAGLYLTALSMAAKLTDDIGLAPEIGWFAETAIAANLASGNYQNARKWAKFATSAGNERNQSMDHWMALIDIADQQFPEPRGQSLPALERLALRGQFGNENLHRLATVLDALEYNVPIPLWEAASKTPQPTSGHLPETGVLSQLQDASKKREYGHTVVLVMQALGPDSADSAQIISLGDSIRALKRAGLEPDARRLGFEALLPGWPHVLTN